jgi:hypothetical protein
MANETGQGHGQRFRLRTGRPEPEIHRVDP